MDIGWTLFFSKPVAASCLWSPGYEHCVLSIEQKSFKPRDNCTVLLESLFSHPQGKREKCPFVTLNSTEYQQQTFKAPTFWYWVNFVSVQLNMDMSPYWKQVYLLFVNLLQLFNINFVFTIANIIFLPSHITVWRVIRVQCVWRRSGYSVLLDQSVRDLLFNWTKLNQLMHSKLLVL